jgi:hypothetical protein
MDKKLRSYVGHVRPSQNQEYFELQAAATQNKSQQKSDANLKL